MYDFYCQQLRQENLREEREIKRMEKNLNIKKKKKGKSEEAATKVTGLRSVSYTFTYTYYLNLLTFD